MIMNLHCKKLSRMNYHEVQKIGIQCTYTVLYLKKKHNFYTIFMSNFYECCTAYF